MNPPALSCHHHHVHVSRVVRRGGRCPRPSCRRRCSPASSAPRPSSRASPARSLLACISAPRPFSSPSAPEAEHPKEALAHILCTDGALQDDARTDSRRVEHGLEPNKRSRISYDQLSSPRGSSFDHLPDELVVSILALLSSSANTPADLAGAAMTDRRFRQLAHSKLVLKKASMGCLAVRAKNWSEAADRFLQRCADAGNLEASYILGMIRFYCARSRRTGAALIVSAANGGHLEAIFSLAVIQFNGSGARKQDRDLTLGAGLCARAARLGHVDATRELGHCLLDGYGVTSAPINGRLLLHRAKQRDAENERQQASLGTLYQKTHHANIFLSEWFSHTPEARKGAHSSDPALTELLAADGHMRPCSNATCGRQETRLHEFRRCSACASANYCSRACQAADWKMRHRSACTPRNQEINHHGNQDHGQEGQPEGGNAGGHDV
ncbi:hypothetical protein ACQ4PT_027509 [Festuca glaucescens]